MSGIERSRGMTVQQLTSRFNTTKPPPPRKINVPKRHAKPPPPKHHKSMITPPPPNSTYENENIFDNNSNNSNNNDPAAAGAAADDIPIPPKRATLPPKSNIKGVNAAMAQMGSMVAAQAANKNNNSNTSNNKYSGHQYSASTTNSPNVANPSQTAQTPQTQTTTTTTPSTIPKPRVPHHRKTSSFDRIQSFHDATYANGNHPYPRMTANNSNNSDSYNENNNNNGINSNNSNNPLPPPKVPSYVTNLKSGSEDFFGGSGATQQSQPQPPPTRMNKKPKLKSSSIPKKRHSLTANQFNQFRRIPLHNTQSDHEHSGNNSNNLTNFDSNGSRTRTFKASFDDIKVTELEVCGTEALIAQMNDGTECLRIFSKALSTFATQQKEQANSMLKLFEKSKKRYGQMEGMPNFTFTMELVHQLLEETVKRESEFASFLDDMCVPMIHSLEKHCEKEFHRIHTKCKKDNKMIMQSKSNLEKVQKNAKNAVANVIKSRNNAENSNNNDSVSYNNDDSGALNKAKNFKKLINKNVNAAGLGGNNLESNYEKAKNLDTQLKSTLKEYEKDRNDYINRQFRSKQDIVNMEHYRVDTMLQVFSRMASKQESILNNNAVGRLQTDILNKTSQMDAKLEVQKFVRECVERHGKWEPPVPSISEFQQKLQSIDFEYRDMFYSVEDAMSLTRDTKQDAQVPAIVSVLCEKVAQLNGFQTEGIFRISALKSDVKALKLAFQTQFHNVDSIDFSIKNGNKDPKNTVHIYASLLKDWMRGLHDSVIPQRYYDYCIDMAKNKKLGKQHFNVFFSQIPQVNREILKYISEFCKEIIKPENLEINKMNVDNLAVVFGPNLLRCPSADPQVMMMNNMFEKEFFVGLINSSD